MNGHNHAHRLPDNRALLASIGHRLVRTVANDNSRYAEALFAVVLERKPNVARWETAEWQAVLEELDASELTIAQWLEAEHLRRVQTPAQP